LRVRDALDKIDFTVAEGILALSRRALAFQTRANCASHSQLPPFPFGIRESLAFRMSNKENFPKF